MSDPANPPKYSPCSKAELAFFEMPKAMTALLQSESDRGAILILATYLEQILGLIVRAACVSDSEADKILLFQAPAGGFGYRIQLCSALGLIHPDEVRRLNAVQKIRNRAAHYDPKSGFDVLFDNEATIAHVGNMSYMPDGKLPRGTPEEIREIFVRTGRLLATQLYMRLRETHRPQQRRSPKELANEVRERWKDSAFMKKFAELERQCNEDGNSKPLHEFIQTMTNSLAAGCLNTSSTTK